MASGRPKCEKYRSSYNWLSIHSVCVPNAHSYILLSPIFGNAWNTKSKMSFQLNGIFAGNRNSCERKCRCSISLLRYWYDIYPYKCCVYIRKASMLFVVNKPIRWQMTQNTVKQICWLNVSQAFWFLTLCAIHTPLFPSLSIYWAIYKIGTMCN